MSAREPHRRPHVIREDQERRAVRNDAAVQRHAVHDRAHAVLANAEVEVAAGVVLGAEKLGAPLMIVLVELARSAEPPIELGNLRRRSR